MKNYTNLKLPTEKIYWIGGRIGGGKSISALRQSNQTLCVSHGAVADSDSVVLEDSRGHRYARQSIDLETKLGLDYFVFSII